MGARGGWGQEEGGGKRRVGARGGWGQEEGQERQWAHGGDVGG